MHFRVGLGRSPTLVDCSSRIFRASTCTNRHPRHRTQNAFLSTSVERAAKRLCAILRRRYEPTIVEQSPLPPPPPPLLVALVGQRGAGRSLCGELVADLLGVNRLDFDCNDLWSADGRANNALVVEWMERGEQRVGETRRCKRNFSRALRTLHLHAQQRDRARRQFERRSGSW